MSCSIRPNHTTKGLIASWEQVHWLALLIHNSISAHGGQHSASSLLSILLSISVPYCCAVWRPDRQS